MDESEPGFDSAKNPHSFPLNLNTRMCFKYCDISIKRFTAPSCIGLLRSRSHCAQGDLRSGKSVLRIAGSIGHHNNDIMSVKATFKVWSEDLWGSSLAQAKPWRLPMAAAFPGGRSGFGAPCHFSEQKNLRPSKAVPDYRHYIAREIAPSPQADKSFLCCCGVPNPG